MNAQEFRRLGHQLVDWIADYREGIERLPVMSAARPGQVRAAFPDHPPAQGGGAPLVVYASDQGHASIEKAALLAGFGRAFLRLIPTDGDHALRLDRLEEAIEQDVKTGLRPCAVVACVGTTGTTAVDPVAG